MKKFKYKNVKIILKYTECNIKYYAQYYKGWIILIVNKNLKCKDTSKLLHKIINNKHTMCNR